MMTVMCAHYIENYLDVGFDPGFHLSDYP